MKKLIAILAFLPLMATAFPTVTNRLYFDPNDSTGAFDDFLWRWSGYDDQRVEMYFINTAPSNVGFRLAYPQRGRVFMDVMPPTVSTPTTITNLVETPWNVTYFFDPLYPQVTVPAYSNVTIRDNILLNIDGVLTISNRIITTTIPTTSTNVFTTGQGATNGGTVGATLSNFYFAATSVVVSSSTTPETPEIRLYTNYVHGITGTVSTITSIERTQIGSSGRYSVGPNLVTNGTFSLNMEGWLVYTNGGDFQVTTNINVLNGAARFYRGNHAMLQLISGLNSTQSYVFAATINNAVVAGLTYYTVGGIQGTITGSATIAATFIPGTESSSLIIIGSNTSTSAAFPSHTIDNISIRPFTTVRYDDTTSTVATASAQSESTQYQTPRFATTNTSYTATTGTYGYAYFEISRTNLPPDGPYFAEMLTYGGTVSNPAPSRTLAKGQVTVENSIYGITNYAAITSTFGPYQFVRTVTGVGPDSSGNIDASLLDLTAAVTAGVNSISYTGAVSGDIVFTGSAVTQTGNTFNITGGETSNLVQKTGDTMSGTLQVGSSSEHTLIQPSIITLYDDNGGGGFDSIDIGRGISGGPDDGLLYKTLYTFGTPTSYKIWDANSDGAGSGLDADTIDGVDSANLARRTNTLSVSFFAPIYLRGFNTNIVVTLTATGGLQVGDASFKAFPSGDIEQDSTNSATLGLLTAQSLTLDGDTIADFTRFATGTPIYTVSGLATGTPIYSIAGLATGAPLYEVDLTPYATGTPIYTVAGLATGAPLYEIDLSGYATGTPVYSVSGLATGTPLYEVDLSAYATGTPIYTVAGLATGTPLYEVDLTSYATGTPIYTVAGLATGTPIYSVAGLATGTPLYEIDLTPYATGTPIYTVSGLATGTPLYEVDLSAYATGTPIYTVSGLATGTPLYTVDLTPYATGTPLYVETGTGTLVAASIAEFMPGSEISNNMWNADNDGAGSGLDADKLDGAEGAAYHTLASFQAYTTNAMKFFVGNVTSGQAGTYGSIVANRTNGTTWLSLGSTNWIKFAGAINEF